MHANCHMGTVQSCAKKFWHAAYKLNKKTFSSSDFLRLCSSGTHCILE